jgi:hypothetical protein
MAEYVVLPGRAVKHGKMYEAGETIELDEAAATQLLADGAIGLAGGAVAEVAPVPVSEELTLDESPVDE